LTVFNKKDVDHTKEPMFFGESCNTARYDKMKYPKFDSITEQQLSFFWQPQEVALSTDINDFKNKLNATEKRIYILNLQYQTLLDSVQGRSPNQVLLPICSIPELETWIETWAFSETIHSRSYTYIIKNIFDNPSEILDDVMRIPQITSRAGMVTKAYDVLEELIHDKTALMYDKKVALFRCIISIHALEAIRFYVSFACAYSYVERGLMEGNGKIMTLINRDEFLHSGGTHYIITRWMKGLDDPEMTAIAKEYADDITSIILDTYNQECDWIDFLFSEGNIPLLNGDVLKSYLQYLCDSSLKNLGCPAVFGVDKTPLPWLSSYTNSGSTQVAPQEVELSSYKLGSVDMNTSLSGLSLDD
jgi:ribonucleoside-diphosphate reductase beta chain